jgi:SAM-dependent methyltransferase
MVMGVSCQQGWSKVKVFHDQARSRIYREADELAIATEGHAHLCNILKDVSCSFGRNISILDLGCGTGRYFHCLHNVEILVGIDISMYMLKECRNPVMKEEVKYNRIHFICGSIFSIGITSQSFDFIYSIGVFTGHSSFNLYTCNQLFDLLKPGGKLFFTVTDIASHVTYMGLREVMENSKFMQYKISKYGSASTLQKGIFYECIAIKDIHASPMESTSRWSAALEDNISSLDVVWRNIYLISQEIMALIPPGDAFILVDHEVFRDELAIGRRPLPFLERDGKYWGPPPDDITAIRELERLRRSGASFIAFAWPAFWWLDHYSELHRHLRSQFRCVLENELLIVFDLQP